MRSLSLLPSSEHLVHGEELYVRKLRAVFAGHRGEPRPVEMLRCNLLGLGCIEIFKKCLSDLSRSASGNDLVDQGDRRLGQDASRRIDYLELAFAELTGRKMGLIFPGEQNVTDLTLHESRGRTTRARIEHRHVFIESRHELSRLVLASTR